MPAGIFVCLEVYYLMGESVVRLNELYRRIESDKQQSEHSCIYRDAGMLDILRMVKEMPT